MENEKKENGEETIDVEVKVETQKTKKTELTLEIATGSKLTKADAGRALDSSIEARIKLRTFKAMEPEL